MRPLDPQEVAVARFPRSPAVFAAGARRVTFTDVEVVRHRAWRVVPGWSPVLAATLTSRVRTSTVQ
jgi:hypothetical protein